MADSRLKSSSLSIILKMVFLMDARGGPEEALPGNDVLGNRLAGTVVLQWLGWLLVVRWYVVVV